MPIIIRPAIEADRAGLRGPALRSWLDAYVDILPQADIDDAPAMLERAFDRRITAMRVALLDGVIAGFYSLGNSDDPEKINYLWHLYVDPLCQRRGVGRALNDAALAELKSRGGSRVWLDVVAGNEKAIAFYLAMGWREYGREEADGLNFVLMEKNL
ncbi:MAG TPA: GNAT family N-acetyltransferase [Micropepsaceae bacterium]|nr:GNAT family N-acetyltransferase [Micropepsaceae bacterium]